MSDHTVKAYDPTSSARSQHRRDGRHRRENARRRHGCAGQSRHRSRPDASSPPTRGSTRCSARSRRTRSCTIARRQPMAVDLRESSPRSAFPAISNASAISPRTSPSARSRSPPRPRLPRAIDRAESYGRTRRHAVEGRARRLRPARCRARPRGLAARRRARCAGGFGVPRSPDLHDGRSAQHLLLHASSVLLEEHRAHRRSYHEYRRDDLSISSPARRCRSSGRRDGREPSPTRRPEDRA